MLNYSSHCFKRNSKWEREKINKKIDIYIYIIVTYKYFKQKKESLKLTERKKTVRKSKTVTK